MSEKENRSLIGARIRQARTLAGLSQGQVAKLMRLHRPSVSEIEAGNRRVSAEELTKLAEIFDVSTAWLLGEADEKLASDDPRLQLAARELAKIKPDDLDKLLTLLAAMRGESAQSGDG
tara:strand:+ start:483 stop:839 length:357 start_codon:yes stop_codon:yes gene_type:complete